MIRRLLTALVTVALLTTGALADGPPFRGSKIATDNPAFNWTGFYLGAGAGYRMVDASTEVGPLDHPHTFVDGFGAQGWLPDLKGGLDYRFANTPFVLGVFGTWTPDGWGDANFSADFDGAKWAGTLSPTYSLGARFGLVMANNNLIYVGYKRQWADLSITHPKPETISKSITGNGIIGGIEMPLTPRGAPLQMTFGVEAAYTRYDSTTFEFDVCPDVKTQPDDLSIMGRLNIRTGFFGN